MIFLGVGCSQFPLTLFFAFKLWRPTSLDENNNNNNNKNIITLYMESDREVFGTYTYIIQSYRHRFISINKNEPFSLRIYIIRRIISAQVSMIDRGSSDGKMFVFNYKSKYPTPKPTHYRTLNRVEQKRPGRSDTN